MANITKNTNRGNDSTETYTDAVGYDQDGGIPHQSVNKIRITVDVLNDLSGVAEVRLSVIGHNQQEAIKALKLLQLNIKKLLCMPRDVPASNNSKCERDNKIDD